MSSKATTPPAAAMLISRDRERCHWNSCSTSSSISGQSSTRGVSKAASASSVRSVRVSFRSIFAASRSPASASVAGIDSRSSSRIEAISGSGRWLYSASTSTSLLLASSRNSAALVRDLSVSTANRLLAGEPVFTSVSGSREVSGCRKRTERFFSSQRRTSRSGSLDRTPAKRPRKAPVANRVACRLLSVSR